MPVFNWQGDRYRPHATPSIWIYSAVTLPVTATVLYLWKFWFIGEMAKQDAENVTARGVVRGNSEDVVIGPDPPEVTLLSRLLLNSAGGWNTRACQVSYGRDVKTRRNYSYIENEGFNTV
jgi:hypothetical protein